MDKGSVIYHELREHLPVTLLLSLLSGVLVSIFYFVGKIPSEGFFEVLHPAHVMVSALATSAIYWKYHGKTRLIWGEAILVGVFGAILIGTLSDVLLPYLFGNLFSFETTLHIPVIEEPFLILGVAVLGSVFGMYSNLFRVSHFTHIFLSVFASLFYMMAFSVVVNIWSILIISLLVFLTVYIPCCVSDIVFPLIFIRRPCRDCGHWH